MILRMKIRLAFEFCGNYISWMESFTIFCMNLISRGKSLSFKHTKWIPLLFVVVLVRILVFVNFISLLETQKSMIYKLVLWEQNFVSYNYKKNFREQYFANDYMDFLSISWICWKFAKSRNLIPLRYSQ